MPLRPSQCPQTRVVVRSVEPVPASALNITCSAERNHINRPDADSSDRVALQSQCAGFSCADNAERHSLLLLEAKPVAPPHPSCCLCYGSARAGVPELIRQGGRAFAAAAQSGRDFLTTLFLIRCPFVKRVTETVRWHPRAQHSVHIVTAVQ